jgi:UDP:flavonoid glycosyltransferase YjiC (YdhE family)
VLATPQPDWPSHVTVTGAVFYNGPEMLQPELEAFLEAGAPPVVFTLGTSAVGAAGTFYEESLSAVAQLGVRAVLLTGGIAENLPTRPIPENVTLIDRAPHQLLFPRASVVVHQGGAGTTAQALRAGRPMIVVPHGHDQPDNAFRVSNLGVARTIFPKAYKSARVVRELRALLADQVARSRASEVACVVREEGGAATAADAIERVLRDSR